MTMKTLLGASALSLVVAGGASAATFSLPLLETKIVAEDAAEDAYFGVSVAISGNTALVGSSGSADADP